MVRRKFGQWQRTDHFTPEHVSLSSVRPPILPTKSSTECASADDWFPSARRHLCMDDAPFLDSTDHDTPSLHLPMDDWWNEDDMDMDSLTSSSASSHQDWHDQIYSPPPRSPTAYGALSQTSKPMHTIPYPPSLNELWCAVPRILA